MKNSTLEKLLMAKSQANDRQRQEEASLVEAARRDPAAFSALYRRYMTPVYRYFYKRLGNSRDAEDLTSQVFTDVLEGLAYYRERGNFAAWLFAIARHKLITLYRRQRPLLSLEEIEDIQGAGTGHLEQLEQKEQLERMATLVAGLKEDQRELLYLRFTAGVGYAEIGALLGRSEAAVKMSIHRLLRQMAKKWEGK